MHIERDIERIIECQSGLISDVLDETLPKYIPIPRREENQERLRIIEMPSSSYGGIAVDKNGVYYCCW